MCDLCFFSQTRETWREWKKAKLNGSHANASRKAE